MDGPRPLMDCLNSLVRRALLCMCVCARANFEPAPHTRVCWAHLGSNAFWMTLFLSAVTKLCTIYGQMALDGVLVVSVHPGKEGLRYASLNAHDCNQAGASPIWLDGRSRHQLPETG